jgi:hypothetical protein
MIRPVEVQGVIQRVQDVSQIKQNADSKPQIDQTNIQNQFTKEIKHNQEQVVKHKNAENRDEKHDAREKGKGEYSGNLSEKKKKKESGWRSETEIFRRI